MNKYRPGSTDVLNSDALTDRRVRESPAIKPGQKLWRTAPHSAVQVRIQSVESSVLRAFLRAVLKRRRRHRLSVTFNRKTFCPELYAHHTVATRLQQGGRVSLDGVLLSLVSRRFYEITYNVGHDVSSKPHRSYRFDLGQGVSYYYRCCCYYKNDGRLARPSTRAILLFSGAVAFRT